MSEQITNSNYQLVIRCPFSAADDIAAREKTTTLIHNLYGLVDNCDIKLQLLPLNAQPKGIKLK